MELRPYQTDVIEALRQSARRGEKRIVLVAPTGAGKTIIATSVTNSAAEKNKRVLFLAHRRELVQQASDKLRRFDIGHGIIQAGFQPTPYEPMQVASVQTLLARAIKTNKIELPPADVVIIDEAHHVRASTYLKILDAYPKAVVIGLTATPCRGDGLGLGNVFGDMVECPPISQLIKMGFLVPPVVYAPTAPDLSGVGVQRGDYVRKQLEEAVDKPKLVGDIVEHWHRLADGRKTVVFASSIKHSLHIRDEFGRTGMLAEHIDGTTPMDERDDILDRLSKGRIDIVTNFSVLCEGWDQPDVSCCVLARPTKSMGLYRQMAGRVLRPAPGKDHALILDHAGATFDHGLVDDDVQWTLDTDKRADNPLQNARKAHKAPKLVKCPECAAVRRQGSPCPACGWRPSPQAMAAEVAEGTLTRVDGASARSAAAKLTPGEIEPRSFFLMLKYIAEERGYNAGWAAHKYKEKMGKWPAGIWKSAAPIMPSQSVRSWVRSRQIAYAKAREKRGAARGGGKDDRMRQGALEADLS